MPNQKIVVNAGDYVFTFDQSEIDALDVLNGEDNNFCLLHEEKTIKGEIVSSNGKNYDVEIDGERFQVQIKSEIDQILDNMGLNAPKTTKLKSIKAPMPGLVIEIDLIEGQEVYENQKILILEAMKMENVIKIPHDAKIKKVNVTKGQAVEKGQVLIELE